MRGKDLTGCRFGRLVVQQKAGTGPHGYALWLCRCDCGRTVDVRESSLKNGHTTSCGCQVNPTEHCHFTEGTFVEAIETRTTPRNNTSGVRGVSWDQRSQRWVARSG